jgi:hypothetical protein
MLDSDLDSLKITVSSITFDFSVLYEEPSIHSVSHISKLHWKDIIAVSVTFKE